MLEARAKKEDNRQAHLSSKKRKNLSSDNDNDKKKAKSGHPKVINERKKALMAVQE
jgi:hypothetical protein